MSKWVLNVGSIQLELRDLAQLTKDSSLVHRVMAPWYWLRGLMSLEGLYPPKVNATTGVFTDATVTVGSLSDSCYESMLKLWIQSNRTEQWLRDMYDRAVDGIIRYLIRNSLTPLGVYVTEFGDMSDESVWATATNVNKHSEKASSPKHSFHMEHLSCYLPGVLALGAYSADPMVRKHRVDNRNIGSGKVYRLLSRAERDLAIAEALMETCYGMYNTSTGLAPEKVEFREEGMVIIDPAFKLRPEVAESLFVLFQVTQDTKYQNWSWKIFESIDKYCRLPWGGYAGWVDVTQCRPSNTTAHLDFMDSFFMAETLKYLYMIQTESMYTKDPLSTVFSTEGHMLPVFPPFALRKAWAGFPLVAGVSMLDGHGHND